MHPVPVTAVVPKFYGYYVPVKEDVERARQEFVRAWKEKKQKQAREEKKRAAEVKRAKAEAEAAAKAEGEKGTEESGVDVVTARATEPEGENDREEEDKDAGKYIEEANAYFKSSLSYRAWHSMSPILLLEECGKPILADKFTPDERYAFLFIFTSRPPTRNS
jgi:cobalamin biosynthesis Mg chelatase CobN